MPSKDVQRHALHFDVCIHYADTKGLWNQLAPASHTLLIGWRVELLLCCSLRHIWHDLPEQSWRCWQQQDLGTVSVPAARKYCKYSADKAKGFFGKAIQCHQSCAVLRKVTRNAQHNQNTQACNDHWTEQLEF